MQNIVNIKEELNEEGKMLGGLQLAWAIINQLSLGKVESGLLTFQVLMQVTLSNDDLMAFQNVWDRVLLGIEERPSDKVLESVYLTQLGKSAQLKDRLEQYEEDIAAKKIAFIRVSL